MADKNPVSPYVKDVRFEEVLARINNALYPLERECTAKFTEPRYPIIFTAGPQRSGTPLVMQLLVSCFKVGYISNLIARFWRAPYVGALLANELKKKDRARRPQDFTSELGTTYGYDGPHEFGYFWQHWFPYNETHQTDDEHLRNMDVDLFRQELAAVESVFDAPLAFKNPIVFSLNIVALAELLPKAVFVICHRNPLYVAQSTILSRLKYHGSKDTWLSVKPKEYVKLKDLPYWEQIAGQVFYTEQRIKESLARIPPHRHLVLEYQDLCADPVGTMDRVQELVARADYLLAPTGYQPVAFQHTDVPAVDDEEFARLKAACDRYWPTDDAKTCNPYTRGDSS